MPSKAARLLISSDMCFCVGLTFLRNFMEAYGSDMESPRVRSSADFKPMHIDINSHRRSPLALNNLSQVPIDVVVAILPACFKFFQTALWLIVVSSTPRARTLVSAMTEEWHLRLGNESSACSTDTTDTDNDEDCRSLSFGSIIAALFDRIFWVGQPIKLGSECHTGKFHCAQHAKNSARRTKFGGLVWACLKNNSVPHAPKRLRLSASQDHRTAVGTVP